MLLRAPATLIESDGLWTPGWPGDGLRRQALRTQVSVAVLTILNQSSAWEAGAGRGLDSLTSDTELHTPL